MNGAKEREREREREKTSSSALFPLISLFALARDVYAEKYVSFIGSFFSLPQATR
jgi:hypothetical protein